MIVGWAVLAVSLAYIGVLFAIVAVVGTVPYIALQLKAVSASYAVLLQYPEVVPLPKGPADVPWRDTALVAAVVVALFAILFGTRRVDATEHHEGMILAIAAEAVMKLVSFVAVGTLYQVPLIETDQWALVCPGHLILNPDGWWRPAVRVDRLR